MLLAGMNRFFAKHGLIAYIVLIGVMVVPLVFYFADGTSALGQGGQTDTMVARMYGKPVYRGAFQRQMVAAQVNYGMRYPFAGSPKEEQLAEQAFNRLRALHEAKQLRIDKVSDEQLREQLISMFETPVDENGKFLEPNAQPNPDQKLKFNQKLFKQFKENFLPRYGVTARDFDGIVRDNIVIDRLESRIRDAVTVSDREAFLAYQKNAIECEAEVLRFRANSFRADVKVDDSETEDYFQKNIADYQIPDQNKLTVAIFRRAAYGKENEIKVSEEQIRERYEADKATLFSRKQVKASHILVKVDPKASDEVKAEKKKQAEELAGKAKAEGTDFVALVKAHSDDLRTKTRGGDLGWMEMRTRSYAKDAFALKDGQVSDVVESREGFHIIKRIEERNEQPLSDPVVRSRITAVLKREIPARKIYEEKLESDFTVDEVKASHILFKVEVDATEEVKAAQRKKAEEILKKAKDGESFAVLASTHSEGPTKSKAGDLGWFNRKRMVKPFADAAFAMKVSEVSDIVETQFGYHIIKKTGERKTIPFEEAKNQINRELINERTEKGKKAAREAAVNFAIQIHTDLENVKIKDRPEAFRKSAKEQGIQLIDTDFFRPTDGFVGRLPMGRAGAQKVIAAGSKLSVDEPISELIEAGDDFVMAVWAGRKDSYRPKFRQEDGKTLSQAAREAQNDLLGEKAKSKAMDAAKAAHKEVSDKLAAGTEWDKAKGDQKFEKVQKFRMSFGPQGADREKILQICKDTTAGSLSAPVESADGVIIVRVVNHSLPNIETFERFKASQMPFFARQRQQVEIESYYQFLKEKSATELTEDWKFLEGKSEDGEESNETS
jgi:parvulin-like peptidyl-prolyl isomerase